MLLLAKWGGVVAKKIGKAKITWTKGKKKYTCSVKVVKAPTVSISDITVNAGKSAEKISVSKYGNKNLKVKWVSANKEIAVVKNGIITGVSEGQTIITAKIKGNKKTYNKKITVSVKKQKDNSTEPDVPQNTEMESEAQEKIISNAGVLEEGVYETVRITSTLDSR